MQIVLAHAASGLADRDPSLGLIVLTVGQTRSQDSHGGRLLDGWGSFILGLAGEARRTIDGVPIVQRAGQLLHLPAGTRHAYAIAGPPAFESLWVTCSGALLPGLATSAGFTAGRPLLDLGAGSAVPALMRRILRLLGERNSDYLDDAFAAVVQLCLAARRQRRVATDPLLAALDHADRGMDACAASCGLSASQFRRRFVAAYGVAPRRLVQRRRVATAQDLLAAGASLAEAARRAGLHDAAHLCRLFRREVGLTPAAWRTMQQGDGGCGA